MCQPDIIISVCSLESLDARNVYHTFVSSGSDSGQFLLAFLFASTVVDRIEVPSLTSLHPTHQSSVSPVQEKASGMRYHDISVFPSTLLAGRTERALPCKAPRYLCSLRHGSSFSLFLVTTQVHSMGISFFKSPQHGHIIILSRSISYGCGLIALHSTPLQLWLSIHAKVFFFPLPQGHAARASPCKAP